MKICLLMENDWFVVIVFYVQLNIKMLMRVDVIVKVQFVKVFVYNGIMIFGVVFDGQVKVMVMLYLLLNVIYGGRFYGFIENVVIDEEV